MQSYAADLFKIKESNNLSIGLWIRQLLDFQNKGCFRANCRFIHANNDDVLRYKKTGDVTISLARAIAALTRSDTINGIPICKEFQHGLCQRGQNGCRYWHINVEEERMNRFGGGDDGYGRSQQRMPRGGGGGGNRRRGAPPPLRGGGHGDYDDYDDYYPPPPLPNALIWVVGMECSQLCHTTHIMLPS